MRGLIVALAVLAIAKAGQVKVGVLSNWKADAWSKSAACGPTSSNQKLVECNVGAFAEVIKSANSAQIDLLVFPEGYALGVSTVKRDYFEPFTISSLNTNPCTAATTAASPPTPVLTGLSCATRLGGKGRTTVAANVFTINSTGFRHITELVFDRSGTIVSGYHKHHLFPTETAVVTPGSFRPTSFELHGADSSPIARFGLVICYEGFYPQLHNDWSQFDALVHDQGSTSIVWSVGGTVGTLKDVAKKIAIKYNVTVLATEQDDAVTPKQSADVIGPAGTELPGTADLQLPGLAALGYTAMPFVRYAKMSV